MRMSDWSSDVCSSDLPAPPFGHQRGGLAGAPLIGGAEILAVRRLQSFELVLDGHCQPMAGVAHREAVCGLSDDPHSLPVGTVERGRAVPIAVGRIDQRTMGRESPRSEGHTSELPSLMRRSYSVLRLK